MHHRAGQSRGPVCGHLRRGGLLQRFVGEQPARHVGEPGQLDRRLAAQQRRLDQGGGPLGEPGPDGGDVSDPVGVSQRVAVDLGQRGDPRIAGQIGDVGARERQEGLTPVIMTL